MRMIPTAALLLAFPAVAVEAGEGAINGLWARGDGKARVKIEKCGGDLCAVNVWIKPGTSGESVGDRLVMDVEPVADGRYEGRASDPKRGLTYNITINAGSSSMTTRGCVLGKLLCKSVSWSRLQ
ncbi:DUF2147 domain-containing protein [Rhizobium sp. PAMB 3182]